VSKKKITKTQPTPTIKPGSVEFYFDKFAAAHQNPANILIHIIFIPLLLFSVFGLLWAIPFPYIKFLGQYNADFNWSSFLLAAIVYYYLKLSPILSYFMLFIMLAYYYIITLLLQWQKAGGPALSTLCGLIFVISCVALYAGYKKEGKKLSSEYRYKNILIAPLFLVHLLVKRFKIKY
jgi:uncharacterized membrane protein YGL010W